MNRSDPIPQCSNVETIINSIKYDPQVYQWFALLLNSPRVKEELVADDPAVEQQYRLCNKIHLGLILLGGFVFMSAVLFLAIRHPGCLVALLLFILLAIKGMKRKKEAVSFLSRRLLERSYPGDTVSSKTLYQVAEIFSRTYDIPSMVDTIYHWDRILRGLMFVATLILITEIDALSFWELTGYLLMAWLVTNIIIRSTIFYKRRR